MIYSSVITRVKYDSYLFLEIQIQRDVYGYGMGCGTPYMYVISYNYETFTLVNTVLWKLNFFSFWDRIVKLYVSV